MPAARGRCLWRGASAAPSGSRFPVVGLVIASLPLAAEVVGTSFYMWGLPLAACLLVALWILAVALAEKGAPLRDPARRASGWLKGALAVGIVGLVLARMG